jgi:hypothetical protein
MTGRNFGTDFPHVQPEATFNQSDVCACMPIRVYVMITEIQMLILILALPITFKGKVSTPWHNESIRKAILTLILLTWSIGWAANNASKWQMGFNLAFKGLIGTCQRVKKLLAQYRTRRNNENVQGLHSRNASFEYRSGQRPRWMMFCFHSLRISAGTDP